MNIFIISQNIYIAQYISLIKKILIQSFYNVMFSNSCLHIVFFSKF